jgi:tetraacyldisaccharide 4'-kinase
MIRIAPGFWGREPGLAADLLLPFSAAWSAAGRVRRALARPYRAPVPVICVGNLVAGGAGKTPVTLAIAAWFARRDVIVHVVTRGYGGRLAGPCGVDRLRHRFGEVGDEALLLAARVPSWIARDRAAGIAAAANAGAEIVLLDDGFQNPTIHKTLSLIVVDGAYGFGNGRVMPAGPLRENVDRGLDRADALILLTAAGERRAVSLAKMNGRRPVVPAILAPVEGERFAGKRLLAFAGIGRPSKFFATLRALGADVVAERSYPDHHAFSEHDIEALRRAANGLHAQLVTTAKDFVRLPFAARADIEVLEVEIRWPDPDALAGLLAPLVLSARANAHPEQAIR